MQRRTCMLRHPLTSETASGGYIFEWGAAKCNRCNLALKKGAVEYSCKVCKVHFCFDCYQLPVCANSHTLERKVCEGKAFFGSPKNCVRCRKLLTKGCVRYSCKPCHCHLCMNCWLAVKGVPPPPAVPVMGVPAPSGPVALGPSLAVPSFPAPEPTPEVVKRRACKYGSGCYQKNSTHLEKFVHPGDRNYRMGLVIFEGNTRPEFDSLWQFFQFHDPDESGHISKAEFLEALGSMDMLLPGEPWGSADAAWEAAGGPLHGYVNFRQFVSWTQSLGLEYPLGLEQSAAAASCRPCRFRLNSSQGVRCSCPAFQPATPGGALCVCGHKASMHRSDVAERTFTKFIEESRHENWDPDKEGLVEVSDPDLLEKLQAMMQAAHKTTHNWTRDRGCSIHGVNGCAPACSFKHKRPVPSGYKLVTAFRNQNADLWQKYSLVKTAITEECSRPCEVSLEGKTVASSSVTLETPLDSSVNEWYLFHGTSAAKCKSICSSNFRLNLAGSGATWRDAGSAIGMPLYGYGIYLAEHVTKSDEYSEAIPADETFLPVAADGEHFVVLVCRILGGRTNVVTSNEIERDKLKADVFDGPYHSVFGDRVTSLNKPFKEIVVYDKDQCYPEFLLVYTRNYG